MARSREVRKLDQKRATSSTDSGTMMRLGVFHPQPAQRRTWPAEAQRRAPPIGWLKAGSNLAGSVGKLDAQGAIRDGDAVIDGGAGRRRLLAGLEAHIVQERRFGKRIFGHRRRCDEHSPTSGESAAGRGHRLRRVVSATRRTSLAVQKTIDPIHFAAWSARRRETDFVRDGAVRLLSTRNFMAGRPPADDWNCCASPPCDEEAVGIVAIGQ